VRRRSCFHWHSDSLQFRIALSVGSDSHGVNCDRVPDLQQKRSNGTTFWCLRVWNLDAAETALPAGIRRVFHCNTLSVGSDSPGINCSRVQARNQVLRFGSKIHFSRERFCFCYMFKTNFSGHNKILGHKKLVGNCPECLPVATGLAEFLTYSKTVAVERLSDSSADVRKTGYIGI